MTNWYSIFYWLTVADNIKSVAGATSIIFLIAAIIAMIGYFFTSGELAESITTVGSSEPSIREKESTVWRNYWRNAFFFVASISLLFTFIWMFTPSKKDALIIIAGGTVGNFVTQDSSARALPSELIMLLRTKINEEIKETSLEGIVTNQTDTLKEKSKEELIKLLKEKK